MTKKTIALLSLLLLCINALGATIDSLGAPNGFVNDFYGALSAQQEQLLEAKVNGVNQATTVEIGIAIIDSTEQKPIEQFAWEIGNNWKIGKKDVFNGVLILVAVDDRAWFIATAKGIEGALPDIVASRIGENNFPQNFRNNDYYSGLNGALEEIEKYALKDPAIVSKYSSEYGNDFSGTGFDFGPVFIFLNVILITIIGSFFAKLKIPFPAAIPVSNFLIFVGCILLGFSGILFFFALVFSLILSDMFMLVGRYRGSIGGTYYFGRGHGRFGGGGFGGFSGGFGGGGGFSGGGAGGRW